MTDDTRLLAEADRSARAARRARIEGRCVHCHEPYEPGTWIILTDDGTAHRACLRSPDPLGRKRRRPKPRRTTVPAGYVPPPVYRTAVRPGKCHRCGARWERGATIGLGLAPDFHKLCGACVPVPVKVVTA